MAYEQFDFKVWHKLNEEMLTIGWNGNTFYTASDLLKFGESAEYLLSTGAIDRNGVKIHFDSDIIKIADYEYSEKHGAGFCNRKTDIKFILERTFFETNIKLIDPPKGLGLMSPAIIFNRSGTYSHLNYPSRMEVIGNVFQDAHLLAP